MPDLIQFFLKMLIIFRVACHSSQNLMSVSNLGVCFGPTLMRQREETMAAIMDIKFANVVVEILIEHYHQIFETAPDDAPIDHLRLSSAINKPAIEEVLAVSAAGNAASASRMPQLPSSSHSPGRFHHSSTASSFFPKERTSEGDAGKFGILRKGSKTGQGAAVQKSSSKGASDFLPFLGSRFRQNSSNHEPGIDQLVVGAMGGAMGAIRAPLMVAPKPTKQRSNDSTGQKSDHRASSSSCEGEQQPPKSPIEQIPESPIEEHEVDEDAKASGMGEPGRKAKAMYDCEADEEGELSFKKGDVIENSKFNVKFF